MARRTIEISSARAHLAVEHDQLLIIQDGQSKRDLEMRQRIPCEDIGLLIVDHREVTYTHAALAKLAEHGASLVVCSSDHLPAAIMLPISSHSTQVWRVQDQIACSKVLKKQLWTQLIQAKIRAQSMNIVGHPAFPQINGMIRRVRSGDPTNLEAQAARAYWQALLPPRGKIRFKRLPGDRTPPNCFLDYGYAVLRAAIARALVGAGLLPALGIHHANRSNAFCLADDLIEPVRPMIDRRVRRLVRSGAQTLDQDAKATLLLTLTASVSTSKQGEEPTIGPLSAALPRYAASLAESFSTGTPSLRIPVEPPEEDESPCQP